MWEKWHIITTSNLKTKRNCKRNNSLEGIIPRYHGKKESSNGARVAPIISNKEISGDAEGQRQTHGGLNNYKGTASDTHEQVSLYNRLAYIRRIHSSHVRINST
jgi:hypothetical protein